MIKVIKNKIEIQETVKLLKENGKVTGFVPTMGALHAGHISLIEKCKSENDITIASIFVNPAQFNEKKDFNKYPRTVDEDIKMLEKVGCDIVFVPKKNEIYPKGNIDLVKIDLSGLDDKLEGKHRPGHFDGVVTIVKTLFDCIAPHRAYFGQKDFQQLLVIKRLVEKMNFNIEIVSCPIVRDKDGLAMSSRNRLLKIAERKIAPQIYESLKKAEKLLNYKFVDEIKILAKNYLEKNDFIEFEYFEIMDAEKFTQVKSVNQTKNIVICTAVRIGKIRLIDNIIIK
ncbi:MAG: pantoate--beta-alanine ligase [Bacteroidota bacterium]|nr:pantoate--beta-alanine ligase [Bacteroidota bacterium]